MFVTGPYLEGKGSFTPQMYELSGPEDAVRTVDYWAAEGATSFKAYMNITRAELKSAIEAAYRHGIKVTGHLCSIGFREAAELRIDNLEHGLWVDTEFAAGKKPNTCPAGASIAQVEVDGPDVRATIEALVKAKVAVTSTLAVFEAFIAGRPPIEERFLDALSEPAAISYLAARGEGDRCCQRVVKKGDAVRAGVREGGRPADDECGSDGERRRAGRVRGSAKPGTAGRGRVYAAGGDPDRDPERGRVPGHG